MMPHGVMFHHFHDDAGVHPRGQGSIGAQDLARMIEQLGPQRILPARTWFSRAVSGTLRPTDLCLTFDDNLRCQYDLALPVLRRYGLTGFWFVYSSVLQDTIEPLEVYRHFRTTQFDTIDDFYGAFFVTLHESESGAMVERLLAQFEPRKYLAAFPFYSDADRRFRFVRDEVLGPQRYFSVMDRMLSDARYDVRAAAKRLWMDDDCLRRLHDEGHVIGLHSHTHPTRLERLSEVQQYEEYAENASHLRELLGEQPVTMSHPCNSYNAETLRVLQELGIVLGFRANMAQARSSPLEYPREDHANLMERLAA